MNEYVVKSGDTLSKIAQNNKTDLNTLVQLNDIIDPNKIQVGQAIKLPGSSYSEEISKAKKQLEAGTTWGAAWWNVKNAVPDADNLKIDKDLNKEFWAQPGAFEKFTAEKKAPLDLDLELPTGIAETTPSMLLPKVEPDVKIIEVPEEDIKVEVIEPEELKKPREVEIIEPEFIEPEVTIVTPEGVPIPKPAKRPEDIPPMDVGRSFFGGITNVFEDKVRKFGDKLDEMFRPENQDVFEEVRDDVAPDVIKFFEPIINTYNPAYKVINKFLEGHGKEDLGTYFTNRAANIIEEEREPSVIQEVKVLLNDKYEYDKIENAFKFGIVKGKPVEGLLQFTAGAVDKDKFEDLQPVREDPKVEPWEKKLTQADKEVFGALSNFQEQTKRLEALGINIKYSDDGIPEVSNLGINIEDTIDNIYKKYDVKPDNIVYKNNQFVIQKYSSLESLLNEINSVVRELEHLDIKAAAPDIYKKITQQLTQLAGKIQLITDVEASTRQLNEYNTTYEEATKTQEQIAKEMVELQKEYDSLLDPEMIEYIENMQRVDIMTQIEFQAMQNYGFLNQERINKLNDVSQKFEDARTRLDINTLQAENAVERHSELKRTIDAATEDLIGITNTKEFKDNLTKYNILAADQADILIQSMKSYQEADEWLRRNEKAVIDETIRNGDNFILAQAEVTEFGNEVTKVMDDVIKASSDFANAWGERADALQYQKVADLAHASAVSEAVEKKFYLFGIVPSIFNKTVMREAFGNEYTWTDTKEVYSEYIKNRFGGLIETILVGGVKAVLDVPSYPFRKTLEAVTKKEFEKPSEAALKDLATFYTWLNGAAIPSIITTAATLSDDLEWVGLPTDTPAGHELRNIALPDKLKQGLSSLSTDKDPGYNASRTMRTLMAWLNMPGPEDQQLLWTKFDKREVVTDQSGKLELFMDPWDIGNEKRIEQIKKLNPHIKDFDNITEGTKILLYKGSEFATEYMRKQDALYNFMAGKASEERFITDKVTNIYSLIPRGENYSDTVGAVLDLNDFNMRGIDPTKIPAGMVIRIPKVQEMPELSNLIDIKNRLEFKSKCPLLFQIREEAFNIAFDPVDLFWYPAGRAIRPITRAIGLKAYKKLASQAEKNVFTGAVKSTIDLTYSIGKALRGTGPLPQHYTMPTHLIDAKSTSRKLSLIDLLTKLDTKNPTSLATLSALMTKFRGISLSKIFPYEVGKEIAMTDKMLNRLRAENEILFIEAIQKVSQEVGESSLKVKSYVHEYIADPTHASPYAESLFWKFNEHMGLSEGRLIDMMHKYPDSYYDRVKTTKVSDIKDLVSKEIADDPAMLETIIELNQFNSLKIKPDKIPANMEVVISDSNFFKELEKEIFRGRNMSKFEQLYLANNISRLDVVGRQALLDFFQYWDPKKDKGRPIYSQVDLDKRIEYWRKKFDKDAPEQKSIDEAIKTASFYRDRTEYWAKVIEEKYAVPIKMSDDMMVYTITPDNFMKLTPEERSVWDKNGMLFYTDPGTGQMRVLVVHDTKSGLGGDLMQVIVGLKAVKMENLKKMVVGSMENKWKKTVPENYEMIESKNSKTGEKEYRLMYTPAEGKSRTLTIYSSLSTKTKGFVISDVTSNDLLHTAYLGKRIGKDGKGKGWYHTLDSNQQGELSSILKQITPDIPKKRIAPIVADRKPWQDVINDAWHKGYNKYDIHKGEAFEYMDHHPDIDIVLTVATSLEDLYHSNKHFYDSLRAVLSKIKKHVDDGTVGYTMDPVDQLIYFLMDMNEGAPNFFSRKEHQIIELLLRGQDLTDVNISELLNSQKELGIAWSRSKQAKILKRRAGNLVHEEGIKELAAKTFFNQKEGKNMNKFETLKEQLKVMPGIISKKNGGIRSKGNVGIFTDAEAAAMFAKYGDASYMMADRRLNREFSHLFREQVPQDFLPARFTPVTEEITKNAVQAMAKISKMSGATKATVPTKIADAVVKTQDSRIYLPLEAGDISKKEGGKIIKAKSMEELEAEITGEIFLPLPSKGIGQKALDKLNVIEKNAAQAKVDMIFAREKLELTRIKKRSIVIVNKFKDAYETRLRIYKNLVQDGKDYANRLGDEGIKFTDRTKGKSVLPGRHEATEFVISPGLEKTLESIKLPKLANGQKNPIYRHRFRLPMESEEHRLLYEYLKTRDDFTEGIHYSKSEPQLKERMTSDEIIKALEGKELNPIIYLLTKRIAWKDGVKYGIPNDQIIRLVADSIDPTKFKVNDYNLNTKTLKEELAKTELQKWDGEKYVPRGPKDTRITALEIAKADVEINEMDLMTTVGYTSKQLSQKLADQQERSAGKIITSDFISPEDLAGDVLTSEDLSRLSAGDMKIYESLINDTSDYNTGLGKILDEWNTAFYSLKNELGGDEFKPAIISFGQPVKSGEQLWDIELLPTGTRRERTERRMLKQTNGNVIHQHLLSTNIRKELTKKKKKYKEIDFDPDKFAVNIGNAFDVGDKMGPDDMVKWIDDKSKMIDYNKYIDPLEKEVQSLKIELAQVSPDTEYAIKGENLRYEKTKLAAKKLPEKTKKQADVIISTAEEARNIAIARIKDEAEIETKKLVEKINNKNNELSILIGRRDSDQSISRHLLRGDSPKGTLFDKEHGVSSQFIKDTYSDIETQIIKKRDEIKNLKASINEPGKYLKDPNASIKAIREGTSYVFEDASKKKTRDVGINEKLLQLSNAERELRSLESLHDMVIPWNLAKANGIKFTADELYWAGKGSIIDSMSTKLDNLSKLIIKRLDLINKPDALKAINIPRVVFPSKFAPSIDEKDIRKAFYDKLPGIKSAKELTLFKTDVIDIEQVSNSKNVVDVMQKLLDKTIREKEFPFIYDMTGKLKQAIKREQNVITQSLNRVKDVTIRKEYRDRLKQIDLMLKKITIIIDSDFLASNLKKINTGKGMSASFIEFNAIEKAINKMKERGSIWLFGERSADVTPGQLKDSIYGKGMTDKSREYLKVMRDDYNRIARKEGAEPAKGYPHHFPRDPESLTTQILGINASGRLTTASLDKSVKAVSETAFKDSANANLQAKIVDYDVGARNVISYNAEIKGKNVLVRSDKATILSSDFKNSITNAIKNDVIFFFPTFMHAGEKSIYGFIKGFKNAKIKFIDARDSNIIKMLGNKPVNNITIDYLLSNQITSVNRAMRSMYDRWGYSKQNRILLSPERMKNNMRAELNSDLALYGSDPNKFPPAFITEKAARAPSIAGYHLQSTKQIVVDWASVKGRQDIKKNWEYNIKENIAIYRKELLENLEKKYVGEKIPAWHKDMVEKQVESLKISTELVGDQVFKFDMPMRMWERWYKNVSDKLFYYSELSARNSGLDEDLNFGANIKFDSYPNRLLMYKTLESIMRWAPVLPNTMFAVGRALKTIWIWSILLLQPGWMVWNSISDGVRAMIGGRSIRTFIDMQRAFVEGSGHLVKKFGKDIYYAFEDIKAVDIIAKTNLKTKTGRLVSAQYDPAANKIYYDTNKIKKDFDNKIWTKPKVKGVHAYSDNAFKTVDEWENFVIAHEKLHATAKLEPGESRANLENRINNEAYKLKDKSRFEVFDLTKVAEVKRTEWNPLTSKEFREAWLAKEKRRMTKTGEVIDVDDWEHITSSGLTQVTADPERAAAHAKVLREDGISKRFAKRRAVIKGDIEIFAAQMEEARRQIMAFDLIYRKAFTKAEANARVKTWLYDYRDLTMAGQIFRKFFPFYTFSAKTFQLYLKQILKFGPGVYNAASGLLDAWEDATYELPDQYKDRIKIGDRTYWLPRFGIMEYAKVLIDPWNSLKEMVDNPLKVAFNLGWGPLSGKFLEVWQKKSFWDTGPLMRDFSATGWYKEEVDRYKQRDDAKYYGDISYSKEGSALMSFLITFCPPTQIIQDMFKMDVGFTLRGGSLLQSKKARSIMKYFGLNILKMDDIAYVFDRLNKLPPHLHYLYKKSLQNEDPELYNYFRQYQILSRMKKILEAKDGKSKNEKITELHRTLVVDTYFEKEFQKNGAGDAWLAQNPEFKAIVKDHFNSIFIKYGVTSGTIIGKKKFELAQVDASLRKMFEQIKTVDATRVKKMNLAGIEHPFIGKFDKQELRDALYNSDGSRKFKTIDEAVAIIDKFDAMIDLLELEDYKAQAEKTYVDWQLMSEAAKDAKRNSDAKYYRRMGMVFSVIPEGIEKLSDEQAQVYWDKWRMLKETLIDSVPEYKKRYEDDLPQWQKDYYAKNAEYMSRWVEIRKDKDEDDNFFDKFYSQPDWFQRWYFLKNPKKALYFPIIDDYSKQIAKLVKAREETGVWDSKKFHEALDFVWGKQNALKAWDESKPGVYNYIDKHRQVWKDISEDDTKDYFDLFYQNEGDPSWEAYREYYFNKPENEYKKITYPFMRTWTGLFDMDEKNDTNFSSKWFWSPAHAEARKLYGEHHPLEDGKNKLDYQQQWKDWSPILNEDRGEIYDLILNSDDWFKNEYFRNHPDREIYYGLASDMRAIDDFSKSIGMFFDLKNKKIVEAWERDKPGTIANKKFWRDYVGISNNEGRLAALDFYFDPKNKEQADSHERNNPGAHEAYNLWRSYEKLPKDTWIGRKDRRQFLKENPKLKEWWGRDVELTTEQKEVIIKEEIYYTILDKVSADGKGRQYYIDYYKAKANAKKYLDDNPDLKAARELRFASLDPVDKTIQKLQDEYNKLVLQEDKNQFLKDNPELDSYFQNMVPPGIKKIRLLQKAYFNIIHDDEEKQRSERRAWLEMYPELIEYWSISSLPDSYYTDKTIFEKYQTELNKANDYFSAVKAGDWVKADKLSGKLPKFPPDIRTEEGRWLMNKLYNEAMATWATTFGTYMSTYYFRSLPSWLRNEYYRKHPESKIISYTPMSRSLNNAVVIENSKYPDLTWARRMMQKYGKNLPAGISKQVQKIMVKWGEWDDRGMWTSAQWSEWWLAKTARSNGLRQKDLDEIPLLRRELARAQKMFSYSMLPIKGGRKHGVINPFIGSPVLLPELTVGLENDIIKNK